MLKLKTVTRWVCLQIWAWFPQKLPVGLTAFNEFSARICQVYGFPLTPAYRQAIAMHVQHLNPQEYRKRPRFFGVSIMKAQANEVAFQVIQDARTELKRLAAEEEAKAKITAAAELEQSPGESLSH